MAKGKKATGKHSTSNGERSNVNKKVRNIGRREYVGTLDQMINKRKAWKKGKRVMLTIPNPNAKDETNIPFIRVEAATVWGSHKRKNPAPK